MSERSYRRARRQGMTLCVLAASVLAVPLPPASALEPQRGAKKPLLQQGVAAEDLEVTPSLETYRGGEMVRLRGVNPRLATLEPFFQAASSSWDIHWDRRSDRPHLIQGAGYPLLPGAGNALSLAQAGLREGADVSLGDVERLARGFLTRYPQLLRVAPRTLRLDSARSGPIGNGRGWILELQQLYAGVPVEGASVFFRINNGNIVQFGADRVADVRGLALVPRAQRPAMLARLLRTLGIPKTEVAEWLDEGTLKVYPTLTPGEKAAESFRGRPGYGYAHRLVWEFSFRRRGEETTYKAALDAHSGKLVLLVDLNRYAQVRGGIFPVTNTDLEVLRGLPFASVANGGTTKVTDAEGNYDYSGGDATVSLNGRFVRISDACGPIALSNGVDGTLNFGLSLGTDCATPGLGGTGNTHSARSGFYHLTRINRKAAGFLPTNAWLNGTLQANMNINQTCNAFWNGSTVNFYRSGGGCSNTGEISAVFLHEWGHGLDANTGGAASEQGTGEAVGDTFAFLETKDPCIGQNFQPGRPCPNCTTCTGVRDVSMFAQGGPRAIARPDTVAADNGINCDRFACPFLSGGFFPYQGPMGYEGHCESYIASSANWDLAQSLIAAHGTDAGWAAMDQIWYESLVPSKSAYQVVSGGKCNPSAVVNGCAATNWYTVYLAVDDDDGNLANGTPNGCRIWDAFNAHGIACGTRPACSGGCTPSPTANAGPDQTITAGQSVTIGTPAVAGHTYSWSPGGETTAQITVSPAATTTYTVTASTSCGSASDSVVVTVQTGGGGTAVFDPTLRVPKCATVGGSCDSGPSLLLGRDGKGPEPEQPNTINGSCPDGTSGTFHADESIDQIKVSTVDGGPFAPGKQVQVEATVWAWTQPATDTLELYFAANAASPSWTAIATNLKPTRAGAQTLSATYTLPAGELQAVRARLRYLGTPAACGSGAFNDHDDLVFAVAPTP